MTFIDKSDFITLSHQSAGQVSYQRFFLIATHNNLPDKNACHLLGWGEAEHQPSVPVWEPCAQKALLPVCPGWVHHLCLPALKLHFRKSAFSCLTYYLFVKVCHSLPKWYFQRTRCLNNRKILYLKEKLQLQMHVRGLKTMFGKACVFSWCKKCVKKAMSVHPSPQQVEKWNSSRWFRNVFPWSKWPVTQDNICQVFICNFKLIEYFTSNCMKYKKK